MTTTNTKFKTETYSAGPLPHDEEMEQVILGRIIMPSDEYEKIEHFASTAEVNDFYLDKHKKIYIAMLELHEDQIEIDLLTLRDRLQTQGTLEEIGGSSYLTYLVEVANHGL